MLGPETRGVSDSVDGCEGGLGRADQNQYAHRAPMRRGLRDHLDADDLGQGVAEHLDDHERDLVVLLFLDPVVGRDFDDVFLVAGYLAGEDDRRGDGKLIG